MTNQEYISQKFASIGLPLTDADLLDMGLDADTEITDSEEVYKIFIQFIPKLLIRPSSLSEGGSSITRADRQDIALFYQTECKRLGLTDVLTKKPTVRFI